MGENIIWLYDNHQYHPFKIYRGDVLIHDFVPRVRKKDGVICFYDRVTGKVYTDSKGDD